MTDTKERSYIEKKFFFFTFKISLKIGSVVFFFTAVFILPLFSGST